MMMEEDFGVKVEWSEPEERSLEEIQKAVREEGHCYCRNCQWALADELKKHTDTGRICEVFGFQVDHKMIADKCLYYEYTGFLNGADAVDDWNTKPCYVPKEKWK